MEIPRTLATEHTDLFIALEQKFGSENQLCVAIEECAELTKELTKALRGSPNDMRIVEEIADVLICLQQLMMMYDADGSKVALFINFKLERLKTFFIGGSYK